MVVLSIAFAMALSSPLQADSFRHSGLSNRSTAHCNALRNAGPAKSNDTPKGSFCPLGNDFEEPKSDSSDVTYSPPPRDIQFQTVGGDGKRMNAKDPRFSNLRLQFHRPEKEKLNFNAARGAP